MAKVFLSHSSKDKSVVDLFKTVLLNSGLGISDDDIAYTSAVETGVPLGCSIPQYIKSNIADSDFVFLFISDNYRHSEVCLNEMGASWALDKNVKPLVIYDHLPFESVGWLYHMNLCARLSDSDRLDELRDEILEKIPSSIKTVVWNRQKAEFISRLKLIVTEHDVNELNEVDPVEPTDELGILDYRELFDMQIVEFVSIIGRITEGLKVLAPQVHKRNQQLISITQGPFNTQKSKGILIALAKDYDQFSSILEECIPLANEKYSELIDSTKILQMNSSIDKNTRDDNHQTFQELFTHLISARKEHAGMRDSLTNIPDIEKTQIKAKRRMLKAMNSLIEAMDGWITRTSELLSF